MGDQLQSVIENSAFSDIYADQKLVFQQAGKILSQYPDAINVTPIVVEGKLDQVHMETTLLNKKKEEIGMSVNISDLQTNPEIRLLIK